MRFIKSFKLFELNIVGDMTLSDEESKFLDMIRKKLPLDYSKYLTYIKNKGLWFAQNQYDKVDPKKIKEKERKLNKDEKQARKDYLIQSTRRLIPSIYQLNDNDDFNEKFKLAFDYATMDFFKINNLSKFEHDQVYSSISSSHFSQKINNGYSLSNTLKGLSNFIEESFSNDPSLFEKFKSYNNKNEKLSNLDILSEHDYNNFIGYNSDLFVNIRCGFNYFRIQMKFNIKFGTYSKEDPSILNVNLKKQYNKEELTPQDVSIYLNQFLKEFSDKINLQKIKNNAEIIVLYLLTRCFNNGKFIPFIKNNIDKYPNLNKIIENSIDADSININIDSDKMGFYD